VSNAKLRRWHSEVGSLGKLARRTGGEVGGGAIPAKLTIAPASDQARDDAALHETLQRAVKDIKSSGRLSSVTHPFAGPGQWIEFNGVMRYGKVRRNNSRIRPST
jgi:hypothetical protein